ncbi:hypothetical protein [Nocardia sp. NPDC049149]|uniref:hypothetical protein n=1 Tax=Nocardia sp. NPDC049149 TaxID=3364315 RepID=UPI00371C716E
MEQSVTLRGHAWVTELAIPGFVRIDEMRQVGEYGEVDIYVIYDDTKLHEVHNVLITNNGRAPLPSRSGAQPLGKFFITSDAFYSDGGWIFSYYYSSVAEPLAPGSPNALKTMVVYGTPGGMGMQFYVPGFVRVDKMRQVGAGDQFELYVVYDRTKLTEIHRMKLNWGDQNPNVQPGKLKLDIVYRQGLWSYAELEDTVL